MPRVNPGASSVLVKLQVDEPVTSGACGGCHGLYALAYARNMYISTGKPLRGVWFEADQKIKRYIAEAKALQNADGSFSSNHFKGPGYSTDFATRISTSGHELEWLMIALPQSKLKEEWIRKAITSVARDLIDNKHVSSDCGPLFHGMHALVVYRQRTVPGYLVPQFNSHLKLADRGRTSTAPLPRAEKATTQKFRLYRPRRLELRPPVVKTAPSAPADPSLPTASGTPARPDLEPVRR
jgi:hypothetical protein